MNMTINKNPDGTTLTLAIDGRIDTQTAPELEAAIKESIDGVDHLVLDFAQVPYISSAGLRIVLAAQNWMDAKKGTLVIRNAAKFIVNVFKVTGFDSFLTLE